MGGSRDMKLSDSARMSAMMVGVLWLVFGMDTILMSHGLAGFGIVPRTTTGLVGVLFSPLLHANLAHLIANSLPLFVLLILFLGDRRYYPGPTLAIIWLASGLGTWLIGRGDRSHIGASSVIFGLVVYLMVAGLFMRTWRSLFVAVVVFFLFGGALLGVIPHLHSPISWEGHLCGAIAGGWVAKRNHQRK